MSLDNCNTTTDPNSSRLDIKLIPNVSSDSYAANCQNLNIATNTPGYSLTVSALSNDNTNSLTYQNPTTISPLPKIPSIASSATPTSPAFLTTNTWGFAVENKLGFDTSYSTNPTNIPTNKFANLPTTGTTIANTTTMPTSSDNYSFYYAARVNSANPAGTYATIVTYTAIGKPIPPPPLTWKQISAGGSHVCGIASDDWVYCWGENANGQLGNNSTNSEFVPIAVGQGAVPVGATIKQISAGDEHTCAIANDNQVYCWGGNNFGQIGDGTSGTDRLLPVAVNIGPGSGLNGKTVKVVATAFLHTCAIASDDQVYCWGNDDYGQVGDGAGLFAGNRLLPTATDTGPSSGLSGKTVLSISAGFSNTCAIASDNQAYCWGNNFYGQIGNDATDTLSDVPTAVDTGPTSGLNGKIVLSITSGTGFNCTTASDNQAYCWGLNNGGQIGDGTSGSNRLIPTAVDTGSTSGLNGKTVKVISSGYGHTCAVASDNQAYCWGDNSSGQIGDGTTGISRLFPVAVDIGSTSGLNSKTVKVISSGGHHTCVIANDNQIYCWGDNSSGQIGDGTSGISRLVPTVVTKIYP